MLKLLGLGAGLTTDQSGNIHECLEAVHIIGIIFIQRSNDNSSEEIFQINELFTIFI